MKKVIFLLTVILSINFVSSQGSYKTKSGVVYEVGDTIKLGDPLSHLGWISVYKRENKETYMNNRNLVNKEFVIKEIIEENPVVFKFELYKTTFSIKIDEAIDNKEIIPPFYRKIETNNKLDNLKFLEYLKSLYDKGILTKEEYELEKKKLLRS
jgi:hypothetical protein